MPFRFNRLPKRSGDPSTPERLFLIALLHLYGYDCIEEYRNRKYKAPQFLMRCCDGTLTPEPNEVQSLISSLVPAAVRINLYICSHRRTTPSHTMSLHKDDTGLWRLTTHKIRVIPSGNPPRDGIQAHWSEITPPPDIAAGVPIKFTRVIRGGRNTQYMLEEIEQDWELSRQLTHCVLVGESLGGVHKDRATIWNGTGKGVMAYVQEAQDSFIDPFTFTGLRIRSSVKPGEKFRVKIYGDVSASILSPRRGKQPRYFATEIKEAVYVKDEEHGVRTLSLIQEILESQIVPTLGLSTSIGTQVFVLHYDPPAQTVEPVRVATLKLRTDDIPAVRSDGRFFTPNFALLERLKTLLLTPQQDGAYCHRDRIQAIMGIMSQFTDMKKGKQALLDFYARDCGSPFTVSETEYFMEMVI